MPRPAGNGGTSLAKRGPNLFARNFTKTRGLNTADSDADMEAGYARSLLNYSVNRDSKPTLRGGVTPLNSTVIAAGHPIISIHEWISNTSTVARQILVQTDNGRLFRRVSDDSYTELALPAGVVGTARWYSIMFRGSLLLTNGTDSVLTYDGTTVTVLGGSPQAFDYFTVHKQRVWGIKNMTVYYSALRDATNWTPGTAAGSPNSIELSSVFATGDILRSIRGTDEFIVIFGDRNIAIYSTDTDQTLIEILKVMEGVGIVAPDAHLSKGILLFWSEDGWKEVRATATTNNLELGDDISDVVDNTFATHFSLIRAAGLRNSVFTVNRNKASWLMVAYPRKSDGTDLLIRIFNYRKKVEAWFEWNTKVPLYSIFVDSQGTIYAGGDGYLYEMDSGTSDRVSPSSAKLNIRAIWELPYLYFDDPITVKMFRYMRMIVENTDGISFTFEQLFDFGTSESSVIPSRTISLDPAGPFWDEAYWDEAFGDAEGRTSPLVSIDGRGIAMKPMFIFEGFDKPHTFLYLNFEYKKGSRT